MTWARIKQTRRAVPQRDLLARQQLLADAKKGSTRAFEAYRKMNEGLFEKIIKQYARYVINDDLDDMRQEGLVGLMRGIQAYDPEKALLTKPEGYVFSWVRAYVSNFARNHGHATNANRVDPITKGENGEEHSLFDFIRADDDRGSPEDHYSSTELVSILRNVSRRLPPKERLIMARRTFSHDVATLEDVGAELGVSRERVRQMEIHLKRKITNKIRQHVDRIGAPTLAVAAD